MASYPPSMHVLTGVLRIFSTDSCVISRPFLFREILISESRHGKLDS